MVLFFGADHAGFELKSELITRLKAAHPEYEIIDVGVSTKDSVDYPDIAAKLCQQLIAHPLSQRDSQPALQVAGVLICGSGQGMAIKANRNSQIRAAIVYSSEIAELARSHNNAQVICLGARFCSADQAESWLQTFVNSPFAGGRHQQRVAKLGE